MVGLNFETSFLNPDGRESADTSLDLMLRHTDELLEWLGEDGVGMGSDFDGASIPDVIGDASGLQRIIEAFQGHGYGDELIEKIAWKNWLAMLEKTIG